MEEENILKKYNQAYLEIIMRYKEYIESKEDISVAELPKLVIPDNEMVLDVVNKIKETFTDYNYERDFYSAAKSAFDYVHNEISLISLPIQFWLFPQETIKCGAGDVLDKAALLCSMLIALGDVSAKIIISASDESRHVIIYSEYNGMLTIDIDQGIQILKNKEELLKQLEIDGSNATAYEFNDKMYNNLK
jgi:hypothetical protein